jgi:hypothetical protein
MSAWLNEAYPENVRRRVGGCGIGGDPIFNVLFASAKCGLTRVDIKSKPDTLLARG